MYHAKILADSLAPCGQRLTTFEVTYPRFVHAEFMTHREFSRNSASSRAIPIQKMIERIYRDPVVPVWWGKNQAGMQAREELAGVRLWLVQRVWLFARFVAIAIAWTLWRIGLHKQIANRLLEPWMWITVIASATQMSNFFALRCHPDAQPEIQRAAYLMREAFEASTPRRLSAGDWHLPLVFGLDEAELAEAGYDNTQMAIISCGRCARVSYLTHDGKRDPHADVDLSTKLIGAGHMSPFEHAAEALDEPARHGNFVGFRQYRKLIAHENDFGRVRAER